MECLNPNFKKKGTFSPGISDYFSAHFRGNSDQSSQEQWWEVFEPDPWISFTSGDETETDVDDAWGLSNWGLGFHCKLTV